MIAAIDIQVLWSTYGAIFLLMLSTFLLGYGLATWFGKKNTNLAVLRQKRKIESLHNISAIKDIDTIFTEIKPKIIDIVKETQKESVKEIKAETVPTLQKIVAEKAKSTYVSYSKQELALDLSLIGHGTPSTPDDLTKIEGIGPYVEERLNNIGIYNYEQISKLQPNEIRIITELIEFFPGRIERDKWVEQCNKLMSYRSKL